MRLRAQTKRAFTRVELLVVLAVVAVMAVLLFPALSGAKAKHQKIGCENCLKQVALAFRLWADDHHQKFTIQLSTKVGGTLEFVGSTRDTYRHFLVISNELITPKLLLCPQEAATRIEANSFGEVTGSTGYVAVPFAGNRNLSYFVGVDASQLNPRMFLCGDRNVTNGTALAGGLLSLTTNRLSGWTAELHVRKGNVALVDGSVSNLNSRGLNAALARTGAATNRLAIP